MRKECFVIQCFDNGAYDKRYKETFAPAIQAGGAIPMRADEILGTRPIIQTIESSLQKSGIAFAEVSEDNPNVFLELGYAIALNLPVVIVCDKQKRSQLPFDIQHRPIIFYSTEAQSDFEQLQDNITKNVKYALTELSDKLSTPSSLVDSQNDHIDPIKRVCLVELIEQSLISKTGASLWALQKGIANSSCSGRMVALAITSLVNDGLVKQTTDSDFNGNEYEQFSLSEKGKKLILRDYHTLMLEESKKVETIAWSDDDLGEKMPF